MKPVFLGLAAAAAMALPAAHALAGGCGGGPIDTPDLMASHVVVDLQAGSSYPIALTFVQQQLDPTLSVATSAQTLEADFNAIQGQLGEFKAMGSLSDVSQGDLTVVTVPVQFAQGNGVVQLSINPDLTIAGVAFVR